MRKMSKPFRVFSEDITELTKKIRSLDLIVAGNNVYTIREEIIGRVYLENNRYRGFSQRFYDLVK